MRILLFPFSWIYGMVVTIRNFCYDRGFLRSQRFGLPVILVGNLSAGGSGKSPLVHLIAQHLAERCEPVILSRGYKRKSRGLLFASDTDGSAAQLGDEPAMYHRMLKGVHTVVCADRQFAVNEIMKRYPQSCAIVMDDGYQHRRVDPGLKILVTPFHKPYYDDCLLPAGDLRESRSGSGRADIIVVSKCPHDMEQDMKEEITAKLRPTGSQQVFFSFIDYGSIKRPDGNGTLNAGKASGMSALIVAGIADPSPMTRYLKGMFGNTVTLAFSDHQQYRQQEIIRIRNTFNALEGDRLIVTTEKDIQKLSAAGIGSVTSEIYVLPLTVRIDRNDDFFRNIDEYTSKP